MTKCLCFLAILVLFSGCSGDKFPGLLSQDKMENVLWDVVQADILTEQFIKRDSSKNKNLENMQLQNKIFALHHVTRDDFYKSYDYYVAHADQMKLILDSISARAERDRSKMIQQRYNRPHPPPAKPGM